MPSSSPSPKTSWTESERRTVDLHLTYWAEIFCMNNWKLYRRYQKHLPKDQRSDVDRLCEAVALGDEAALRARLESILARVWDAEDWDQAIRDPALEDGDEAEWQHWREQLKATA